MHGYYRVVPTNTVTNVENLAGDIPVIILPPYKVMGIKSTPIHINIKTLPKPTTKLA